METAKDIVGTVASVVWEQAQKLVEKAPGVKDKIAVLTGAAAKDPRLALSYWNDTETRASIVDFITAITNKGGPEYVDPADRIAVFDNDGTLWPEKPLVIQMAFTLVRMAEMAEADPSLRDRQPYKSAYDKDYTWLDQAFIKHYQGDNEDIGILLKELPQAFAGLTIEQYLDDVKSFFVAAKHPTLKKPYAQLGYLPMIQLLRYLEAHEFQTFIASGGERDFMRGIANDLYGIPPERVVGSSLKLEFKEHEDSVDVLYKGEMEFFDDGIEKPIRIWSRIGRRPLVVGGNSNGDIAMMRFANIPGRRCLRVLVHHDDAKREFAYDDGAEEVLKRAATRGWTVVSMKSDWNQIFPE